MKQETTTKLLKFFFFFFASDTTISPNRQFLLGIIVLSWVSSVSEEPSFTGQFFILLRTKPAAIKTEAD